MFLPVEILVKYCIFFAKRVSTSSTMLIKWLAFVSTFLLLILSFDNSVNVWPAANNSINMIKVAHTVYNQVTFNKHYGAEAILSTCLNT